MKRIALIAAVVVMAVLVSAVIYLWTPSPPAFDRDAARETASQYEARIIRDRFGAPHIYGARDADVAFGLAYAHAEDDWATIEDVLFFSRGDLALRTGKAGAITDYLVAAIDVERAINEKYETDLAPATRALLKGYAAGLNLWCAEQSGRCASGAAPVTEEDIVAGFVSRIPFFFGFDSSLKALYEADPAAIEAVENSKQAYFHLHPQAEFGSNAMAVAPSRSTDGHTRLMVNSHQPFTGPVAWYEARVKSEEGLDMIGPLFPGAPMVLHGARPELGWAFTVNKPDLVDIYALETNQKKNPTQYRFDGAWREFEISYAKFRVKLFGPFSLPVKRRVLRTVHGPAFETPSGVYAVAFAGDRDVRAVEQYYRMNKATTYDEWFAAMTMQAIPSFNVVYADRTGVIAYFYNAAIPERSADWDWTKIAPGDRADLVWRGTRPFGSAPNVQSPASGYVVNANHSPFAASSDADNPDTASFPPHFGVDRRTTNRGLRIQALYGGDDSISADEFLAYKMDNRYAEESRLRTLLSELLADADIASDPELEKARALLAEWNGSTDVSDRGAALAIRTGQLALGYLMNTVDAEESDPEAALRRAVQELEAGFGRIDPEWGEVNRLKRGGVDLPLNGAPDVLRAIYGDGDPSKGPLKAVGGDTHILYADWSTTGELSVQTIHQFGSATLDASSPHYADQAPIFAEERFRSPPMTLEAVLAEATADYRPGVRGSTE